MSGETECQVSGWTVDTLKEHMEQRFRDSDRAVQAALLAAKEAVLKAETATEKRFEATNEFRGQLADQTATLIPRAEASTRFDALSEKLSDVNDRLNKIDGVQQGAALTAGRVYAAIGAAVAIIGLVVIAANAIFK
jgi:hypothetical protein